MGPEDTEDSELQRQVSALREALAAIMGGGIDAVVIGDLGHEQVVALRTADHPYRVIMESMGEGSATVSESGVILFANSRLAELLGIDHDQMLGRDVQDLVVADDRAIVLEVLAQSRPGTERVEVRLDGIGPAVPVLLSCTPVDLDGAMVRCLVITDLTAQKVLEEQRAVEAAMAEQRAERRRLAFEVNDTIVQGLVAAEMAFDVGQTERARALIARTSRDAREWIDVLVESPQLAPGMAVRYASANPGAFASPIPTEPDPP